MSAAKHTPFVWGEKYGIHVLDPDGWREDGADFFEPITYAEWKARLWGSTIKGDFEALP
jgi:hypothetical protein